MKEDKIALQTYHEVLGNKYTVVPFDAQWITEYGGVFNCATWTVEK